MREEHRLDVQSSRGWLAVGAFVSAAVGLVSVVFSNWLAIAFSALALAIQAYRRAASYCQMLWMRGREKTEPTAASVGRFIVRVPGLGTHDVPPAGRTARHDPRAARAA